MYLRSVMHNCREMFQSTPSRVEIPLLCLSQRPSQSFGVAYLLNTLVYLDKSADTHDPRAHQRLRCPSASVEAPNSVKGMKRGEKVHSVMQKCLSLGYVHLLPWRHH